MSTLAVTLSPRPIYLNAKKIDPQDPGDHHSQFDRRAESRSAQTPEGARALQVDPRALSHVLTDVLTAHSSSCDRLVRVSLTTPKDFGEVRPAARRFCAELQARGESSLVMTDRREDRSEHLFGFIGTTQRRNGEIVRQWCEGTGGALRHQLAGSVGGWRQWAETGERRALSEHMARATAYMLHEWPEGQRSAGDVYSSGVLGPVVRVITETPTREELLQALRAGADGLRVDPGPEDAPQPRRGVTPRELATGECARCRGSLAGRRADCATCSTRCRMALSRSRRAGGAPS